jgi:LmbE family N-acetylglucosaminyl deacetylase
MSLGTILGVWAHPDDETYLSSGLMAQAVRDGDRVVCVTATRGEGGTWDEAVWPSATLGEVRERELMRCLKVLGVTEHEFLDLPDIDMDTPLPEHGAARVVDIMREVRPDTVLTFGPEGMTGHVGHQSIHHWTTDAFHAVAPRGARLYYAVDATDVGGTIEQELLAMGAVKPGVMPVFDRADIDLVFELDADLLELKMQAFREQESQSAGMFELFGEEKVRLMMSVECFNLAAMKS